MARRTQRGGIERGGFAYRIQPSWRYERRDRREGAGLFVGECRLLLVRRAQFLHRCSDCGADIARGDEYGFHVKGKYCAACCTAVEPRPRWQNEVPLG